MQYSFDDNRQKLANSFENANSIGNSKYFDTHEFVNIIDFYLDNNDLIKAKKAIVDALNQHPYSIDLKIRDADWMLESGDVVKSMNTIDDILEINNTNSEALELKGDILLKLEKPEEAVLMFQEALHDTENTSNLLSKIGFELLQLNMFDVSLQFFLLSLDYEIDNENSLHNAVYCYEVLNSFDDAIIFLEKFLNKDPENQIAWHLKGIQYKALDLHKEAIESFNKALEIDPKFLGAFFEKAKSSEELKQHNEAISIYKHVLTLADANAWTYFRIAECYINTDKVEDALLYYFKTIHEDPNYHQAWYKIALIHNKNKNYESALETIKKASIADFDNETYNSLMARLNLRLADYENALTIYGNLIDNNTNDFVLWIEYASILNISNSNEEAINILIQATSKFTDNSQILYHLSGMLYESNRDIEGSLFLNNAVQLDPKQITTLKTYYPNTLKNKGVQEIISNNAEYLN